MGTSAKHRGWKLAADRSYLAALFNSTEVYRITASAFTVTPATTITGALTLSAALSVATTLSVTGALSLASDIDLSASGTGVYDIILKDAVADALSIRRATTDMIVFDSSTPKITITPALTVTGAITASAALSVATTLAVTGIATMTERVKMATAKPVIQGMVAIPLTTRTALTSGATVTYTAAQLVGGFISDTISAACAATVDTPANIVAAVPGAVVGSSFLFVLRNTAGSAIAITLTANGAATVDGTATVAQSKTKLFLALITNIGSTTEAVVFYSLGELTH